MTTLFDEAARQTVSPAAYYFPSQKLSRGDVPTRKDGRGRGHSISSLNSPGLVHAGSGIFEMRRIKEKHLDDLFSKLVRGRTAYNCESGLKDCPNGQAQCSHLFGRRARSTRFAPENAVTHCAYCHMYLTANPLVFGEWIRAHLGRVATDALRLKAHATLKRSQPDMCDLYERMKSELARMDSLRMDGETGRIEFAL